MEETEWHRITFYNRLAEIAGEYLKKGRSVYIEGRLKLESGKIRIPAPTASPPRSSPTKCRCSAGAKTAGEQQERQAPAQQQRSLPRPSAPRQAARPAPVPAPNFADMDDDIPF